MQLSKKIKLYPTKYQFELIKTAMTEYVSAVKRLVFNTVNGCSIAKVATADVRAGPSGALNGKTQDYLLPERFLYMRREPPESTLVDITYGMFYLENALW